jgi:hypothetical protein
LTCLSRLGYEYGFRGQGQKQPRKPPSSHAEATCATYPDREEVKTVGASRLKPVMAVAVAAGGARRELVAELGDVSNQEEGNLIALDNGGGSRVS